MEKMKAVVYDKSIRPVIDCYYLLEEVPVAMRYVCEGHASGKVIVKCFLK